MRSTEISLSEYKLNISDLEDIEPLQKCCSSFPDIIQVEPLENRNILEVNRSCIVQCPECHKCYVSKWE